MKLPKSEALYNWFYGHIHAGIKNGRGNAPSKAEMNKRLKGLYQTEYDFVEYEERHGRVSKLIAAKKTSSKRFKAHVEYFYFDVDNYVGEHIQASLNRINKKIRGQKELYISIYSLDKKLMSLMNSLKFKVLSKQFYGKIPRMKNSSCREFEIRKFQKKKDLGKVIQMIWDDVKIGMGYPGLSKSFTMGSLKKKWEEYFKRQNCFFVALDGKKIIGVIGIGFHKDKNEITIMDLFVRSDYRNRSLAQSLIKSAMDAARERKAKYLYGGTGSVIVMKFLNKYKISDYFYNFIY